MRRNAINIFLICVLLLFVAPGVSSENQNTTQENIGVSESDNSAVYNKNDVRDGESGTQNYAMLSAKSCEGQFSSSDCSSQSWAEIILETEFGTNVKLVNISIEYESSGEISSGLGNEYISTNYEMTVNVRHKFGKTPINIESGQTTGSDNVQNISMGTFATDQDNTLTIELNISHSDTDPTQDT